MATSGNTFMGKTNKSTLDALGLVNNHAYSLLGVFQAGN
jgi:hypothetical protein